MGDCRNCPPDETDFPQEGEVDENPHHPRDRQRRPTNGAPENTVQQDCCLRRLISIRISSVPASKISAPAMRLEGLRRYSLRNSPALSVSSSSGVFSASWRHQQKAPPIQAREVEAKEYPTGVHKTSTTSVVTPRSGKIRDRAAPRNHPDLQRVANGTQQSRKPGSKCPCQASRSYHGQGCTTGTSESPLFRMFVPGV